MIPRKVTVTMAQSSGSKNDYDNLLPSYKLALLQMVAYRNISEIVTDVLRHYDLNTSKWITLNLIDFRPGRYRVTDIAEILQVEGTFVTNLVQESRQAGLLKLVPHPSDKRARLLSLTAKGKKLIKPVEAELRQRLRPVIQGLNAEEVKQYVSFLEIFIANTHPLPTDL